MKQKLTQDSPVPEPELSDELEPVLELCELKYEPVLEPSDKPVLSDELCELKYEPVLELELDPSDELEPVKLLKVEL